MQPASDERPFFFHLEPGTPAGLRLLLGIASALLVAAGATLGLAARRSGAADARGALTAGAYFAALGLAFLMVEVLVLQRTIRLIGFPALNLGLVLATFLVAAGLGSLASDRLRTRGALGTVLLLLAAALGGLMPLLDAVHAPLERLPLALRSLALVAVLFPFAFAMGMPFPAGLRRLPLAWRALVPYFWGVNGVASIAGSALVVAVVLESGFRQAAMLPAALYLVAAGLRRPFVDSGPARSPAPGAGPSPVAGLARFPASG
jgi:hypothetical protein